MSLIQKRTFYSQEIYSKDLVVVPGLLISLVIFLLMSLFINLYFEKKQTLFDILLLLLVNSRVHQCISNEYCDPYLKIYIYI